MNQQQALLGEHEDLMLFYVYEYAHIICVPYHVVCRERYRFALTGAGYELPFLYKYGYNVCLLGMSGFGWFLFTSSEGFFILLHLGLANGLNLV